VYATAVGGVPDIVSDNETGFIMTNREVNTMIDEVQKILTRDELDDISRRARTQITAKYDFEAAIERYRQLIPYNDSVN
jgi:glycosyltransferase involved in cell wall biosynthesis